MQDYWLKQEQGKPLFPDILWSRPENKRTAGKLLIIGGNVHGFAHTGEAYTRSVEAGIGTARVVLPEALRKTVGKFLENCEYAPSNPSGGFAKQALNELLIQSQWADAILLAGDFGRNSETAVVLEQFVQKYKGLLIITCDAIDYFFSHAELIINRKDTCIVGTLAQLQKLATSAHFTKPISIGLDLLRLVDTLHVLSFKFPVHFITHHTGTTLVASQGKVSTTKTGTNEDVWRTITASKASVFWLQHTAKPFETITTAIA